MYPENMLSFAKCYQSFWQSSSRTSLGIHIKELYHSQLDPLIPYIGYNKNTMNTIEMNLWVMIYDFVDSIAFVALKGDP